MSKLGQRLIKSAEEAVAIAEGRMEPARVVKPRGAAKARPGRFDGRRCRSGHRSPTEDDATLMKRVTGDAPKTATLGRPSHPAILAIARAMGREAARRDHAKMLEEQRKEKLEKAGNGATTSSQQRRRLDP
jgi:hypothetical protein